MQKCLNSESKYELKKDFSLIALQGPKSENILETIVQGVKQLKFMNGDYFKFQGQEIYITRSGYTGEDGFEISVQNKNVENFQVLVKQKKDQLFFVIKLKKEVRTKATVLKLQS